MMNRLVIMMTGAVLSIGSLSCDAAAAMPAAGVASIRSLMVGTELVEPTSCVQWNWQELSYYDYCWWREHDRPWRHHRDGWWRHHDWTHDHAWWRGDWWR
jgi:hypothetical protein